MHVEVIVVTVQFIIKSDKYNDMIQARFWNSKTKPRQKSNKYTKKFRIKLVATIS